MVSAGTAVFEAVGRFGSLIRESDQASKALGQTKRSAEEFGKTIPADGGAPARGLGMTAARAGALGKQMQTTGRNMTVGLSLPVAFLATKGIRTFASFESAIAQAGIKSGATKEQLKQMADVALDMGAKTKFSATEAATAMDTLAALGFNAKQSMAALPGVMLSAQASGEDLALTAETMAKAMNAFNIPASESAHVADVFAQAANTTALNVQGIGDGMAYAGQLGSRYNASLEGTIAWLGRLVDQSVPAASAGAAIVQVYDSLSRNTTKTAGVLKDLGIAVRDSNGNIKQTPALLDAFQQGLSLSNPKLIEAAKAAGKSKQAYRDWALSQAFGIEGAKALSLAISEGKPVMLDAKDDADKLAIVTKSLGKAFVDAHTKQGKFTASGADAIKVITELGKASDGAAEKAGKILNETLMQKLDNLGGSIETTWIKLINSISPGLKVIVDGVTKLINGFGKLVQVPFVGPIVAGLGLILIAIGPVLLALGSMLKLWAKAKATAKLALPTSAGKTARADARAGTTASGGAAQSVYWTRPMPVYLVSGAGGKAGGTAVVGGGGKGATPAGGRRAAGSASMFALPGKGGGAHKAPTGRVSRAAKVGGAGLGGAAVAIGAGVAMGGDPKETAKSVAVFAALSGVMSLLGKAMGFVLPLFARLGPFLLRLAPMVLRFLGPIGLVITIAILIVQHWSTVKTVLLAIWNAIATAAVAVWNWIKTAVMAAVMFVWNGIKLYFTMLLAFWTMVWNVVKTVAVGVWNFIKTAVMAAVMFVVTIVRTQLAILQAIWSAIWNVIKAVAGAVWAGIKAVVQAGINFVKSIIQAGVNAVITIWNGLKKLGSIVSSAFSAVKNAIGSAIDWCIDKIHDLLNIIGKIGGAISGAVGKIADFGGKALSILPGLSTGGLVGGSGRGDTQPRMLEPGEFVVRRAVVDRPGVLQALASLNKSGPGRGTDVVDMSAVMSANEFQNINSTSKPWKPDLPTPSSPKTMDWKGKRETTTVWAPTINNPAPERASESLFKTTQKAAYLGLTDDLGDGK